MNLIFKQLTKMGLRLLTGKIIEKVILFGLEELVKRTSSKVDDKLLTILKNGLK